MPETKVDTTSEWIFVNGKDIDFQALDGTGWVKGNFAAYGSGIRIRNPYYIKPNTYDRCIVGKTVRVKKNPDAEYLICGRDYAGDLLIDGKHWSKDEVNEHFIID